MRLRSITGALMLALIPAFGCGGMGEDANVIHGPDPEAGGAINLALASVEGALTSGDQGRVMGFRVRIFRDVPDAFDDSAYFHSDCSAVSSAFKVDHLATGTGFVLVYEGYAGTWADCTTTAPCQGADDLHPWGQRSDGAGGWMDCDSCNRCTGPDADHPNGMTVEACMCRPESLVELGVRGGITISADGTGEAFYYVQVNRYGAFTGFPLPGADLSGGTVCVEDADCQKKIDCAPEEGCSDGTKYLIHPKAVCDGGVCRVLDLFPLNTREPRAFHAATSSGQGEVAILGGFNARNATQMAVNDPGEETFDASTSLFGDPVFGGLDDPVALPTTVLLGGGRIALLGGATTLKGFPWVLVPGSAECEGTSACSMNLSSHADVVDLGLVDSDRFTLPVHFIGGQAALVGVPGGQRYVYLRPGVVQEAMTGFAVGSEAYLFTLDDGGNLGCAVAPDGADPADTSKCLPLSVTGGLEPRAWAVSACLNAEDGVCSEFVVLGGNIKNPAKDAFGEVYLAELGTVQSLKGNASLPPTLLAAEAAVLDGRIWTFGGITGNGPPDASPMVFEVDKTGSVQARQVIVAPADLGDLQRIFHQVTVLADGKTLLVTGGYGPKGEVLNTWALLEVTGDKIVVKDRGTLSSSRLGHEATLIEGGLLAGSVLVTGGLESLEPGAAPLASSELFLSQD